MPTITKELSWDMGHRLTQHESKCWNIHGHRYTAHLSVKAPALDSAGRVVDFSVLKSVVGGWIDEKWDHKYLANKSDVLLPALTQFGHRVYVLPLDPSAEVIASWLFVAAQRLLNTVKSAPLTVTEVVLYETPTSSARATAKTWAECLPMFDTGMDLHAAARDARVKLLGGWIDQTLPDVLKVTGGH